MTRFRSTGGIVLALCAALVGCNSRTNVSATGSTPSQFTHVFITAQEVWFNTNGSAGSDDSGWAKFPLKTPVTVDLVQQSNGTLGEIANDLRVAPGTYNSILLLPYNATGATATASAAVSTNLTAVGASYPQEADFVDTAGTSHQVALVLPNPEKGIVIPGVSLKVPVGSVGAGALGTTGTTGTTTTGTTATTPTTTTTGTTTSSTASTTTTVSFGTFFDANRDLHLFCPAGATTTSCPAGTSGTASGTTTGVLLSTSPVATDLSTTGGISGTLTLTSLTNTTTTNLTTNNLTAISGRVAIQADAELLSSDTSNPHHVVIASAPVQTDGTFTIYPLQSNSKTPTVYDVVIHGPNIATIIIKNVSVATTTPSLTDAAATTGSVATTTASGAVSLGTFIPQAANAFSTQIIPSTTSPLPGSAAVTFYQTLPASGEVPYAIDEVGIDPINGNLQTPEVLSLGAIQSGTYASSGSTITVTSSTPAEGPSKYRVSAVAPLYTDGSLSSAAVVDGTTAQALTTPLTVTVSGLTPADGSAAATLTAAITESSPGTYTGGELLVSRNGAVIGTAVIPSSALLTGSGSATVSGLPSGSGNYYLSAVLWSATAFNYESVAAPVTVSGGTTTQVAVALN
jgi:mucin-2